RVLHEEHQPRDGDLRFNAEHDSVFADAQPDGTHLRGCTMRADPPLAVGDPVVLDLRDPVYGCFYLAGRQPRRRRPALTFLQRDLHDRAVSVSPANARSAGRPNRPSSSDLVRSGYWSASNGIIWVRQIRSCPDGDMAASHIRYDGPIRNSRSPSW